MDLPDDSYADFFRKNEPFFIRLKEEVKFILHDLTEKCGVKTHSISGRVKELDHALEKIDRKGYSNPQQDIEDIVGCRVVCLFLSDLNKVENAIQEEFHIIKLEDKVEGNDDQSAFGYMSRHYICELRDRHSGARYDVLKGIKFELQLRTMLMDAWANVSHYLAYKGEASIPEHLRRDFYALSGLFYVADKHFELFFQETVTEERHAQAQASRGQLDDEPINLETIQALLMQIYPDRRHAPGHAVSEFVEEITSVGYVTISELKSELIRANPAAKQMEEETPGFIVDSDQKDVPVRERRYADVGIARHALALADRRYQSFKYTDDFRRWDEYRAYIPD